MSIYCEKLVHVQVIINCPYFVAQKNVYPKRLRSPAKLACRIDDVMSYNSLTTINIGWYHNYCDQRSIYTHYNNKFGKEKRRKEKITYDK